MVQPTSGAAGPVTRRPRSRGISVQTKLALSYAGFLIVGGIALLAVMLFLLRYVPNENLYLSTGEYVPNRDDLIDVFVKYAWWAMAGLIVFGLVGGWILAGLVLRPLERIADAARHVRDGRLDERVDLPGKSNELTDLADALDTMLDRVEHTVAEERRFAANASHELRTPHAIIRTMVEVAQADPAGRDIDVLLQRIGTTNDRAIVTTEALLTLARLGRGSALDTETIDLAALAAAALEDVQPEAAARSIRGHVSLPPTEVTGNRALLGLLAANLLHNAIVHNVDGGWVEVSVSPSGLVVRNSGAVLDPGVAATLTEPFVRGAGRTRAAGGHDGAGLGLAIVASIVRAHGGALHVEALAGGGLEVRVVLPR
ncbi:sensor histidine kinase [Microbacterium sp. P06]|uniref:sensor histidine kinase n=1 Tax=Microbacterium sp. P06 TaxID=3366949 RepID=UPI003744E6B3